MGVWRPVVPKHQEQTGTMQWWVRHLGHSKVPRKSKLLWYQETVCSTSMAWVVFFGTEWEEIDLFLQPFLWWYRWSNNQYLRVLRLYNFFSTWGTSSFIGTGLQINWCQSCWCHRRPQIFQGSCLPGGLEVRSLEILREECWLFLLDALGKYSFEGVEVANLSGDQCTGKGLWLRSEAGQRDPSIIRRQFDLPVFSSSRF